MSSRAIRRVQKEKEEREKLKNPTPNHESSDEAPPNLPTRNAFNMLTEADDGELDHGSITNGSDDEITIGERNDEDATTTTPTPKKKKQSQKKKKKSKAKTSKGERVENKDLNLLQGNKNKLDEIDLALISLSTHSKEGLPLTSTTQLDDGNIQLNRLLAVESRHLNALNEMKRLFGNIVLEGDSERAGSSPGRRRGRGPQALDLAEALTGRHSPASHGHGLSGFALRRNFFMMGKEEWPKATSGGLGMESDDVAGHRFFHDAAYRDIQAQFEACVASMDPHRMIELLRFNPYHISTLLQVSEIAKQQGDHSVSGDLLERALFSFGRSVHSSFTTAISQGKARLDFRRPENREFWLAVWRYIANLGQRGTWRTAYEWARLLLSLDPEKDPYRVVLVLDQLALRGGQWEHFLKLSRCAFFQEQWRECPNIQISSALAAFKAKEVAQSRISLAKAVKKYPWVFARLLADLKIEPTPKSIWGKSARTERENFECEIYITYAKDLWNPPEARSFLGEVTQSVTVGALPDLKTGQISTNEARHVLLSGSQTMISLISTRFTSLSTSASDPLPPSDDNLSYRIIVNGNEGLAPGVLTNLPLQVEPEVNVPARRQLADTQGLATLQYLFGGILPRMYPEAGDGTDFDSNSVSQRLAEFVQFGRRIPETLAARGRQVVELLRRAYGEETPPWEMQYLTNRLEEALAAREPEDLEPIIPPTSAPDPVADPSPELEEEPFHFPPYPSDSEASPPRVSESEEDDDNEVTDSERNQRWLGGRGMIRLRDFTTKYGTDEAVWSEDPEVEAEGRKLTKNYAERVLKLEHQRTRTFIVNYTLRQGTSTDVRDLVIRAIQRINRGEQDGIVGGAEQNLQ